MRRTSIMLPEDLKAQAEERARRTKTSLGQVVREALASYLVTPPKDNREDPFVRPRPTFEGPGDLSVRHDDYLYGDDY